MKHIVHTYGRPAQSLSEAPKSHPLPHAQLSHSELNPSNTSTKQQATFAPGTLSNNAAILEKMKQDVLKEVKAKNAEDMLDETDLRDIMRDEKDMRRDMEQRMSRTRKGFRDEETRMKEEITRAIKEEMMNELKEEISAEMNGMKENIMIEMREEMMNEMREEMREEMKRLDQEMMKETRKEMKKMRKAFKRGRFVIGVR